MEMKFSSKTNDPIETNAFISLKTTFGTFLAKHLYTVVPLFPEGGVSTRGNNCPISQRSHKARRKLDVPRRRRINFPGTAIMRSATSSTWLHAEIGKLTMVGEQSWIALEINRVYE